MNASSQITYEFRAFKRRIGICSPMIRIDVRFVATTPLQLQINQLKVKYPMKTSVTIQHKPIIPSLFQIASRIEDLTPANTSRSAPPLDETPFADLMLHPEKLKAALKLAKSQNDAFDASRTFGRSTTKNENYSRF